MKDQQEVEGFLSHYGIKGMKWGVRRPRGSSGRVSTERKRVDQINLKVKTHGKKSLTNKDLADYNKRLEMESKFERLHSRDMTGAQKAMAAGAAFVTGMALNMGKQHIQREAQRRVAKMMAQQAARRAGRAAASGAAKAAARSAARHTPIRPLMLNP